MKREQMTQSLLAKVITLSYELMFQIKS